MDTGVSVCTRFCTLRFNEVIFRNLFPVLSAHILQTTTELMDVELVVFAILACVSDPRPSRSS